ncbi:MAG: HIT domain-containing protein [Bradymonadales bacterium]|nr:HIT domain-containing protein [Bradymonadales bacterium]
MVDPAHRRSDGLEVEGAGSPRSCVFCDILAGKEPGFIVHENELAVALLDINPLARGHCLVLPRRHVPWWHDMSAEETAAVFQLAREVAERIMASLKPEFVAMYVRGRRIPHTHVFLVPTNQGEPFDRHFNALEGFQEAAQSLASLGNPEQLDLVWQQLKIL